MATKDLYKYRTDVLAILIGAFLSVLSTCHESKRSSDRVGLVQKIDSLNAELKVIHQEVHDHLIFSEHH